MSPRPDWTRGRTWNSGKWYGSCMSRERPFSLSSHNLAELSELCTDIGIIDAGKMVLSGSMDEIMERIYTSKQIIISVHDQMEKALAFLKESPMVRTHFHLREGYYGGLYRR